MTFSRLELNSQHGDQRLESVRFVLVGVDEQAAQSIYEHGLSFAEGQAVVSTDLQYEYEIATKADTGGKESLGRIIVLAMPPKFHLGYATFTSAYIERSTKTVMGAPLRYAEGRKQLSFYLTENTEEARKRVEASIAAGNGYDKQPSFVIDPTYVIGSFKPHFGLINLITSIQVSANSFEDMNFDRLESSMVQLFEYREPAQAVLVPPMIRDVIVGTVESVVVSNLRNLRWQGLELVGYKFTEARQEVTVAAGRSLEDHHSKINEYRRVISSSPLFTGELLWLRAYALTLLEIMQVELDGTDEVA